MYIQSAQSPVLTTTHPQTATRPNLASNNQLISDSVKFSGVNLAKLSVDELLKTFTPRQQILIGYIRSHSMKESIVRLLASHPDAEALELRFYSAATEGERKICSTVLALLRYPDDLADYAHYRETLLLKAAKKRENGIG